MIERLKSLEWYWQLLVLVVVGAFFWFLAYYFITSETRAEISSLNEQIEQLKAKNQAAQIATQRINEFRALYASKQAEYEELKVLLPEEREITNVLQGLQDTARESKLIVMRFSPREDVQQEGIMAKPVEVEVDSNFNNLRVFFDRMAKLPRIVSITDFSLRQLQEQTPDRTLHAQFLLTAYYAAPENLSQQAPGQNPANPKVPVPPPPPGQAPPAAPPLAK
ncbi:MAG: type 4a pilus biogenesis protein PilO [Pyrinomonadaceae bacterium]|nr:type 4a pilus biogenesis protein PilO [Pyrinomonadaceae bacterium]MCX7639967.1 type 4a pilus biogenesis protein PilO [Pyrinomonadaceae bacterium]MDW8304139.1 type 4a pilus biogenesis protein PilO [Acidobacteriota bacterium]